MKNNAATWYWAPVEARVSGGLGVTWGKAALIYREEGADEDRAYRSRYVTVWQRDDDGVWRIWLDTGTDAPQE